jgi:hypothetical protein
LKEEAREREREAAAYALVVGKNPEGLRHLLLRGSTADVQEVGGIA